MHKIFMREDRRHCFTLAEGGQSPLLCGDKGTQYSPCLVKKGFTLAEVLVTLGIIGVVAAMTLPTLIKDYQKSVVEARLKWFYSAINQAVRMSVVDNGSTEYWELKNSSVGYGSYENNLEWFNKYLSPYLKHEELSDCTDYIYESNTTYVLPFVCIKLTNNSLFSLNIDVNGLDINYYPSGKFVPRTEETPKNIFRFQFFKDVNGHKESVEPYTYAWDNNPETLKNGHVYSCYDGHRDFCTKLIQLNNWKIPDDYPW